MFTGSQRLSDKEPTDEDKMRTNLETLIGGVVVIGVLMFFPAVGEWLYSFSNGVVDIIWGWFGWPR